ncbi:hypothetical protein VSDG_03201 [Cytospora chrysosperma]|uniref:Uncharacterized protein n=1 Tax=Cytospora chrysosperma TaxID=252740 RepID=A0A423WBA8_CYTCH|nr:hypothetical protein VSDG_03201 [Valsa sordida]
MSRHRDDRDRGRSCYGAHRSKRDHADTTVDSGYGGSAIAATPKPSGEDASWPYHVESARHSLESSRRASPSQGHHGLNEEDAAHNKHKDSDSDTDYDPRDKYYIDVDDEEYENISFRKGEASKDDHVSKDGRERLESDTSSVTGRSSRDRYQEKTASFRRRHDRASSTGSKPTARHKKHSPRDSDTTSTRTDSQDRRSPASSRKPRSKASVASHSRHVSDYRSLSPIPSEWGDSDDSSSPVRPQMKSKPSRRGPRNSRSAGSRKSHGTTAGMIDPDGETASSFLQKLTRGVDVKSVGKVGLDAAAVAAIKVVFGNSVPWQQRIPKTISAGASAAIMDFVVKKTSFQPKGMMGSIFARHFVEIILSNLVVNPVSAKVTGATQNLTGGGKMAGAVRAT